ncbi:hypothetical protein MRS44_000807 [Fusarium solani]|uniref:uncharacterized protein n=1 Tax=Fusarium solani TaxID=169388 RepID=UPI0032C4187A|nr:hypothetical protein MRS44_000807 [Fusarium solani]
MRKTGTILAQPRWVLLPNTAIIAATRRPLTAAPPSILRSAAATVATVAGATTGATRTAATGIAVSVAIAVQRARPGQSYVAPSHTSPWSQAQPDPAEYPAPSIHHLFLFFDS